MFSKTILNLNTLVFFCLLCSLLFTFSLQTAIGSLPAVIISICPQSSICSQSEIRISKRNETAAATFAMEVGLVKDESKLLVWGISNIKLECCLQHICYWQYPSLYIYIYTFNLTKWLFKVMFFHHTYWFTFLPRILFWIFSLILASYILSWVSIHALELQR